MENTNMVLPDYLQNVKIIGSLAARMEQVCQSAAMTENALEEEKNEIEVTVDQCPVYLMSKEVREAYQSCDLKKIQEIEEKSKKDLAPIYSNLSEHEDKAWFEAEDDNGVRFYMAFNDQGVIWAYPHPQKTTAANAENATKYKQIVSVGVYSGNSASGSVFNMEFRSKASIIVEAVLDAGIMFVIDRIIKKGVNYAAMKLSMLMCERAAARGLASYSFKCPAWALRCISIGFSAIVSFGACIFVNWIMGLLDKKFFVKTEIYNWDDAHDWKIVDSYEGNAIIAGNDSPKDVNLPKKQIPKLPPFIQGIKVLDTAVSYVTIVWENDNTFMEGLSTALSLQNVDNSNIGFSWALYCPWAKDTVQKAVNTIQGDLESYRKNGNWNKNPLKFMIKEEDGLPISFMLNAQSGAENNLYIAKINIGAVDMIKVKANQIWNDTGIDLEDSQTVTIKYDSGRWSVSPDCSNLDAEGGSYIAKEGYLLPGSKEGCLVGKIGDGQPFYVGKSLTLSGKSGRLYLGANDDVKGSYGKGYEDNYGELTVLVNKEI